MEENNKREVKTVDYVIYRDTISEYQWIIHRLVIALIVSISLLFISNVIWLYFWNQYDYSSETVTTTADSEGDGMAVNITGGNGGVTNYGQSDGNQTDDNSDETDRLEGDESPQEEKVTQPG